MSIPMQVAAQRRSQLEWTRTRLDQPPDEIFLTAYRRIANCIPKFVELPESAQNVRDRIERAGVRRHPVEYERESLAFNQAYFFRNFYKSLCLLSCVRPTRSVVDVTDLGAGAGPFALALCLSNPANSYRLSLVDRSAAQLSFARRVFRAAALPMPDMKNATLFDYVPPLSHYRIASYWLCENSFPDRLNVQEARALFGTGALFLDYSDILERIASRAGEMDYSCRLFSLSVTPTVEVASKLGKEQVAVHGLDISTRIAR